MQIDLLTTIKIIGGIITAIGSLYTLIKRISIQAKRKEDLLKQAILSQANENIDKVRSELEEKIKSLEIELANQKESLLKDISWLKEAQVNEFRNLAEKISDVRDQLNEQHSYLVSLLARLVDKS